MKLKIHLQLIYYFIFSAFLADCFFCLLVCESLPVFGAAPSFFFFPN